MNINTEYLSVKELGKYLQISYAKASGLARDPEFPKIIFGGRKVFPKTQVMAWMNKWSLNLTIPLAEQVEETPAMRYNAESICV